MVRLLGDVLIAVTTRYCPPKRCRNPSSKRSEDQPVRRRGREGGGLYPELAALGISEGSSPNVQEETGRLVGLLPFQQAHAELARRGVKMDPKAVHRVATGLGHQMLATRTRDLLAFREGTLPAGTEYKGKRIAVAVDGGRVRTRTIVRKSRVGKTRKRKKFRVEWREPKLLILFELDDHGRMERKDPAATVIDGTLQGPDALMELLALRLHRLGAAVARELVFLGDGASWIWARLDWVIQKVGIDADRVIQVLDWCHAVHHLGLAVAALRLPEAERKATYQRLRKDLKAGRWKKVVEELEAGLKVHSGGSAKKDLRREIAYLRKHGEADRLSYAVCRYRKLPVGSGAIESAVRRVINLRLKGSGIYWKPDHAEAILHLRATLLGDRWDEAIERTRAAMRRDRRTTWKWQPIDELAELKALAAEKDELPQTAKRQRLSALAA